MVDSVGHDGVDKQVLYGHRAHPSHAHCMIERRSRGHFGHRFRQKHTRAILYT